jgi:hypothetical protein
LKNFFLFLIFYIKFNQKFPFFHLLQVFYDFGKNSYTGIKTTG